jgi:hypothetical protein
MAEIFESRLDYTRYHEELELIVALDRDSGSDRTDRSRFLASGAALVLAEKTFERFGRLALNQPFEESLAAKQAQMDITLEAMEDLVGYEVADVTAAATFGNLLGSWMNLQAVLVHFPSAKYRQC